MSFLADYFDIDGSTKEHAVCCPFPHHTEGGLEYLETHPSAHANIEEGLFHCKVCSTGLNEVQFIKQILGCSMLDALKIKTIYENSENIYEWNLTTELSEQSRQVAKTLGFSDAIIKELNIKTMPGVDNNISYPVFMYNHLLDIRCYVPHGNPKIKSRSGSMSGFIIPFDLWIDDPRTNTLLCAGEKDMAIARTFGFNAITLTGGENCVPKTPEVFRNKTINIVYDNDEAGLKGAIRIANAIAPYAKEVRIVTKFHEVCTEKGEDIYDYFMRYNKTKADLIECIQASPVFVPTETPKDNIPLVDLYTASKPKNINRLMQSNIQTIAVYESSYITPTAIFAEKFRLGADDKDTMAVGATRSWELDKDNLKDILHLIDNNFTETVINDHIKTLLKMPVKEKYVKISKISQQTVFKACVTDLFETSNADIQPMEFTAYAIGCKLESGKKYLATYKIVPHPYKGQELLMLITNISQANDSVTNFQLTPERKDALQTIRKMPGGVDRRMWDLSEKVKGILGYDGNNQLIQTIDLAFHTVLEFNFGTFKNVRGYLDTLIVGESRIGKSSTADALRKVYGLGTFVSLAGNAASIPGLIGGSYKTNGGSFQTRAGVIPQNHKGLVIFEEFGKSDKNIVSELTDIRSSGEVRIARVSGQMTMPALVRMISLTNVKNVEGIIKPIASYPNGISVITELVPTAEDIARYDLMLILADTGNMSTNPFWKPEEPLSDFVYQTRIRWVWSRKPSDIIIPDETGNYIVQKANELNKKYMCHIKIFGTEAWKKITRLAIAVAGSLVSTDDDFEKLIVLKEHVDYAVDFFQKLYDNPTFKLREYAENERRYTTVDAEGIAALQDLYIKYPSIVQLFENSASISRAMLVSTSGLGTEELGRALNRMLKGLFIRYTNYDIVPTERFRLGIARIDKNVAVPRVGETGC